MNRAIILKVFGCLALFLISHSSLAKTISIKVGSTNKETPSMAVLKCSATKNMSTLRCKVNYVFVSKATIAEADALIRRSIKKVVEGSKGEGGQKYMADICKSMGGLSVPPYKLMRQNNAYVNDSEIKRARREFQSMVTLCKKPSLENLKKLVSIMERENSSTCTVRLDNESRTIIFRQISKYEWLANVGPVGNCNVFYVYSLVKMKGGYNLWEFSRKRTHTNKRTGFCKHIQKQSEMKFGWRSGKNWLDCKTIQF